MPAPGQGTRIPVTDEAGIDRGFAALAEAGFGAVELSDIWLDSRSMTIATAQLLARRAAAHTLTIVGLSTLGIVDSDAALTIAAEVGAPVLCLGLHQMPKAPAGDVSFWAAPPAPPAAEDAAFAALATGLRRLCARAAGQGIGIVIEMNENALIDRGSHVLRLLDLVGADNLGVNPDLGNLTRVTTPMPEPWFETLAATAPHTPYWHVKNNLRMEHPAGIIVTHPCALAEGVIDYRVALSRLVAAGFSGPIVVESYWGDRLHGLAQSRLYLDSLLNALRRPAATP